MRKLLLLLVLTLGLTALYGSGTASAYPCSGNTYYVDVTAGSDANSGCSGSPWQTLQFAMDSANAGDTILVKPGTYSTVGSGLPVIHCSGSADSGSSGSPIIFKPDYTPPGSGDPWDTLDPPANIYLTSNADGVIRFDACDYVEFYGFKVIGPSTATSGANISVKPGSEHDAFIKGEIRDSLCQGVFTWEDPDGADSAIGSVDFTLSRNWIHHNGSGTGTAPTAVSDCFHSNGVDRIQSHGVYLEGNEHQVDNNLVERNGYGFGIQAYDKGFANLVTQNTVLYNGGMNACCGGMLIGGSDPPGEMTHTLAWNNVFAHNYDYGLKRGSWIDGSNCGDINYNTFYDNGGNQPRPPARTDKNWTSGFDSLSCWGANNAASTDPGLTTDPWPKTSTQPWGDVYGGSFSVNADLDGSYKDNAWEAGGFGWSLDSTGSGQTYWGHCLGDAPDRGAYEYDEPQDLACP
jgi:Protein of unknown function (DUF1565)